MDLLREWMGWKPEGPPFMLPADRAVLTAQKSLRSLVTISDWLSAHRGDDFGAPGDSRLHLGLLPQPFCGDLRRASIYVLLLNPGIGATDYYGEHELPTYRNALLCTLRQEFDPDAIPFLFLDPQYAWHGGYGWWHAKLAGVISRLATIWSVSFAVARARLGANLASLELLPYHSASFRDAGGWVRQLVSVALAKAFVRDVVIPRVLSGDAVAIVTRQAKAWDLPAHSGIIRYSGQQARGAHLSPNSPGGQAILQHLA
jgi:hypothetical protein